MKKKILLLPLSVAMLLTSCGPKETTTSTGNPSVDSTPVVSSSEGGNTTTSSSENKPVVQKTDLEYYAEEKTAAEDKMNNMFKTANEYIGFKTTNKTEAVAKFDGHEYTAKFDVESLLNLDMSYAKSAAIYYGLLNKTEALTDDEKATVEAFENAHPNHQFKFSLESYQSDKYREKDATEDSVDYHHRATHVAYDLANGKVYESQQNLKPKTNGELGDPDNDYGNLEINPSAKMNMDYYLGSFYSALTAEGGDLMKGISTPAMEIIAANQTEQSPINELKTEITEILSGILEKLELASKEDATEEQKAYTYGAAYEDLVKAIFDLIDVDETELPSMLLLPLNLLRLIDGETIDAIVPMAQQIYAQEEIKDLIGMFVTSIQAVDFSTCYTFARTIAGSETKYTYTVDAGAAIKKVADFVVALDTDVETVYSKEGVNKENNMVYDFLKVTLGTLKEVFTKLSPSEFVITETEVYKDNLLTNNDLNVSVKGNMVSNFGSYATKLATPFMEFIGKYFPDALKNDDEKKPNTDGTGRSLKNDVPAPTSGETAEGSENTPETYELLPYELSFDTKTTFEVKKAAYDLGIDPTKYELYAKAGEEMNLFNYLAMIPGTVGYNKYKQEDSQAETGTDATEEAPQTQTPSPEPRP